MPDELPPVLQRETNFSFTFLSQSSEPLAHVELLPNLVVNYLGIKWEELEIPTERTGTIKPHGDSFKTEFKFS